jgi:predicted aminopeptidase
VSACEELSFTSKVWRFPIAGSFPFLGWFDLDAAKEFAASLKAEGWDVDVRGASAYSTLGWFRDAILSTMIREGEEAMGELVNVVLHESVHATLYVDGQSHFNESLAEFVAGRLTPKYLEQRGYAEEARAYARAVEAGASRERKFHEAYDRLSALYGSSRSREEKLAEKERVFASLKDELKIKRELSNASLVQFRTYHVGGAEFAALLDRCGGDWNRFWSALRKLDGASSFGGSAKSADTENVAAVLKGLRCD